MGQYYMVVNVDKKQYLHPHAFGDGLKLLEFGNSGSGTMCGLAVLLADGNGRGGGDLHLEDAGEAQAEHEALVGSWAGDRIVVAGDYADEGRWPGVPKDKTLYAWLQESGEYTDISLRVIRALCQDSYIRQDFREKLEYIYPETTRGEIAVIVGPAPKKKGARKSELRPDMVFVAKTDKA